MPAAGSNDAHVMLHILSAATSHNTFHYQCVICTDILMNLHSTRLIRRPGMFSSIVSPAADRQNTMLADVA